MIRWAAVNDPAERLERLRSWRRAPDPDLAIEGLVARTAAEAKRAQQRLGSFVELWEGVIPSELAAHSRVTSLRAGVAHVTVDSSATAYEIDRRLREGLEQELRRAFGRTLVRVRLTVGRVG